MPQHNQPHCIAFAGVVGSSKTPIAHYLSWNLCLPILSNDSIRSEVLEDLTHFDQTEYEKRRDAYLAAAMGAKTSFIYDASIDRYWGMLRERLVRNGYTWHIISLDLGKPLLNAMYVQKNYAESLTRLDQLFTEHEQFLAAYPEDIALHITDQMFPNRLAISLTSVQQWHLRGQKSRH